MIKTHRRTAWALLALAFCLSAQAADLAGMVKTSKGPVNIERGGEKLPAVVGTPIQVADRVRTAGDAAVGITLRDGTLLSVGPNSLLVIDKFAYDATSQGGNMSIGIRKGTLSVASGKIAKQAPESVDFRTSTAVLGVRGTEFVIEVGDGHED